VINSAARADCRNWCAIFEQDSQPAIAESGPYLAALADALSRVSSGDECCVEMPE